MKEKGKYSDDNNIKKINSNIFELLSKKDQKLILNEIKNLENNNIDLSKLIEKDQNKNSLLIATVYYNLTEVSEYLIDYFRNKIKSTTQFLDYLNLRNIKGYDALLYAAFRGNYPIFQKLLDNGAYINSTNITGLNVLHLAAQGNCLNIIASLTEKYIFNINSQDNNGNTALHWAVYFNNQQSIDYLLYYNIDLTIKDINNCTALDIAINKQNDIIIDKIKEGIITKYNSSNNNIRISNFFSKIEILKILMRMYLHIIFFFLILLSEISNQKLIIIGIQNLKINFFYIILFGFLIYIYYFIGRSDPEQDSKKSKNTIFNLISQGNDLSNICPWCVGTMSLNSYHCPYCRRCISNQEFHNSFLNNCIGKNNFRIYLIYLVFFILYFALKLFVGIYFLKNNDIAIVKENNYNIIFDMLINISFEGIAIYRLVKKIQLFNKVENENKNNRYRYTKEKNNFFPEIDNKISGLEV